MGSEGKTTGPHTRMRLSLLYSASPHRIPLDSPQLHPLDCSLHCRAAVLDLEIREEEDRSDVCIINTESQQAMEAKQTQNWCV